MPCITPFQKRNEVEGGYYTLPCGKCPECLKRRVSGWSFRLMEEDKVSSSSMFVTLTYDTHSVPITDKGFMSLCKADLQKFFKRLRKLLPEAKIKYYAVGEYGGSTWRPHYHIILFNADYISVQKAWALDGKAIGHVHFGNVSGASVGYTLKYVMKPKRIPLHKNDDRIKEFSLMSKGLGAGYMTDAMVKWHKASLEDRMYCNTKDGKKIAMPRYYKDKMYTVKQVITDEYGLPVQVIPGERDRIAWFARQLADIRQNQFDKDMFDKYGDDWPRVKMEMDKTAFVRMYKEAVKGRKI